MTENTFDPHFLVVSLGNPPPYADSLHSAGHIALQSLQNLLQRDAADQPRFSSERLGKKATQASRGSRYTLLQCPTLMNVSGPWLARTWREALQQHRERHPGAPLGLVVVHDDLEEDTCVVKVRKWNRSHRGHNGLKSIMSLMASSDPANLCATRWAKISVGIGRPEGRDPATVADYVLKPLSRYQRDSLFEKSGPPVLAALREIESAWRSDAEKGINDGAHPPTDGKGNKGKSKRR
ncbi:peptidyl-tRNA hydrolase [Cryphonectria parasitica EP155]|uniref:peptidyl-tRNA hydrolase n=1 Tax=Cryphonectria parasitica (strain ATCC 38755 / EP155) TaxID=660469 RepID=A0A9P4XT02_CRYP1|nr:peptidyl-tRNA hydrolase [Cryphonectria parasitica EP155]KAF3760373.1 peptidyl-tRNA hydrolase [Cryphonectria parasitica EP155]